MSAEEGCCEYKYPNEREVKRKQIGGDEKEWKTKN